MAAVAETVDAFWRAPLSRGEVLFRTDALTVVSDPALAEARGVSIIDVGGVETIAALSPAVAAKVLVQPIRDESGLRAALADAHVLLHPADAVFYLPLAAKEDLLGEHDQPNVRRLTEQDRNVLVDFASAAPPQDLDDAYVELDHWAVFGAFKDGRLVCAASMYPWGGADLADLGVIALPGFRRQGVARSVVRAACRYSYSQGYEAQYRCQLDNTASKALAASAGFTWFGNWQAESTT